VRPIVNSGLCEHFEDHVLRVSGAALIVEDVGLLVGQHNYIRSVRRGNLRGSGVQRFRVYREMGRVRYRRWIASTGLGEASSEQREAEAETDT
jgi:hypothetical protein